MLSPELVPVLPQHSRPVFARCRDLHLYARVGGARRLTSALQRLPMGRSGGRGGCRLRAEGSRKRSMKSLAQP